MAGPLILIVDDDPTQQLLLGEYLGLAGYGVAYAEDGESGLSMMEAQKPDLVLLDIQMPVMDGFKVLETVRRRPRLEDIPVILLTSLDRDNLKIRGLEAGADDYITKPYNKAELLARIKAALRRATHHCQNADMAGRLTDMGVADLLQGLELASKTASLYLHDMDAEIHLKTGMLVAVWYDGFAEEQALVRIFLREQGRFRINFNSLPAELAEETGKSLTSVLMNVLSEVDEIRDVLARSNVANRRVKASGDLSEFPELEPLTGSAPIEFIQLLTRMRGEVRENLKTLNLASKQGKLKLVK